MSPHPTNSQPGLDLLGPVRVLDLTSSIAGPYAGQLLADLGADVVKVERPGRPDDARSWGPPFLDGQSLWYLSVNRNKRAIEIDYATAQGHELLCRLVRVADIVLVNSPARVQSDLRIDHESLAACREDLIHVSITGYGLEGPGADLPCYDLIAEGHSGVMDLTGEADDGPQKVGTPAADLLAGQDAAMAAMAALVRRSRTGRGSRIDVALVDSMTRFMTPRIVSALGSTTTPTRSGGRDSVIAIYQVFETADEPMTLGLGNDSIWRRFWNCLGQPEWGQDQRYASNAARRERRAEIVQRIQAVLREQPRSHWLELFGRARVPCGPINRLDQLRADPLLSHRGLIHSLATPTGPVPAVGLGIFFDGRSQGRRNAPPRAGQHTGEVFHEWLATDNKARIHGTGV